MIETTKYLKPNKNNKQKEVINMLFFKPKRNYDEILPPPPPSQDRGFEKKPTLFDEVIKPKKAETFPEEDEFSGLLEGLDGEKPKKSGKKITLKKSITQKKQKIQKIKPALFKKIKTSKKIKKQEVTGLDKDFDLKGIDFELPKELEPSEKEIELPETLDEFDVSDLGRELQQKAEKPKEILEAEEEIKSAIEKIKEHEKPSFFRKLFAKKEEEVHEEQTALGISDISAIQNKINEARQALMEFDLEKAKKSYIEAMNLYNRVNPEEQAKVYHDIKELYSERKSAEGLKV